MNSVAVASLSPQNFPPDTVADAVVFKLLNAANEVVVVQSVPAGPQDTSVSTTFSDLAAGTYTVSAERLDGNLVPLVPAAVSDVFTVSGGGSVSITVPTSVAITVS